MSHPRHSQHVRFVHQNLVLKFARFGKIIHTVVLLCEDRSCRKKKSLLDEGWAAHKCFHRLFMFVHLASPRSRAGNFFCRQVKSGDLGEELENYSCLSFSQLDLSHNGANLCPGTEGGLETNRGLPMWKWFPCGPAQALVLISRNELRLEKLSSGGREGRVRWSSSGRHTLVQQHSGHWPANEQDFRSRQPLIQSSKAHAGQGGEALTWQNLEKI